VYIREAWKRQAQGRVMGGRDFQQTETRSLRGRRGRYGYRGRKRGERET